MKRRHIQMTAAAALVIVTSSLAGAAVTPVPSSFVSIAPCRAVDTRLAGGKLAGGLPGEARSFSPSSTSSQGGDPSCPIPSTATAVEATITAVADGIGHVKAFAEGATEPNTAFLNHTNVANLAVSGSVPLSSGGEFTLRNFGAATHLVVDITGYYEPATGSGGGSGSGDVVARMRLTGGAVSVPDNNAETEVPVTNGTLTQAAGESWILFGDATVTLPADRGNCQTFGGVNLYVRDGTTNLAAAGVVGGNVSDPSVTSFQLQVGLTVVMEPDSSTQRNIKVFATYGCPGGPTTPGSVTSVRLNVARLR